MMNGAVRIISQHGRDVIAAVNFCFVTQGILLGNQKLLMGLQTVAKDVIRKREEVRFNG
jgi:hypothetical protein